MSTSTPIPSSVTCFKNGLSHMTFPVHFRAGCSPIKIGPLTSETVNGSVSVNPEEEGKLKIHSITAENNFMIKVHYKLENQEQDGKGNLSYISPGIQWTPNYLVKVNYDGKTLAIGGRATIVSQIQFMDDITLPQLSLVSGAPNIACEGECDPFVTKKIQLQRNLGQISRQMAQRQNLYRRGRDSPAYSMCSDGDDDEEDDFDEEKVGELYHFKIKNVPINYQKATSVPFMDDIVNVPYSESYSIKLDSTMADNEVVPAKHHFNFPLKYAPPLPRGPVMIYLEKENHLTFSSQTRMRTEGNMFSLETTSSSDVDARFSVTSGEKTADESMSLKAGKEKKTLCITTKLGVILVKNRKKEEIELHLKVTIRGEVRVKDLQNDSGKVIEKPGLLNVPAGTNELNPENVITWDIKVPANNNKELGFGYVTKHWE